MGELLLVMSKAQPGRETDYVDWYMARHLPDMTRVPGVIAGDINALTPENPGAAWGLAARYQLDRPVAEVLGAIFQRAGGAEMPLTDAIDPPSVLMLAATPLSPARAASQQGGAPSLLFVALTNPPAGDHEAFTTRYDDEQIPQALSLSGVLTAQRFRLAPETAGKASSWAYLALYELSDEAGAAALSQLYGRSGAHTGMFRRIAARPA